MGFDFLRGGGVSVCPSFDTAFSTGRGKGGAEQRVPSVLVTTKHTQRLVKKDSGTC